MRRIAIILVLHLCLSLDVSAQLEYGCYKTNEYLEYLESSSPNIRSLNSERTDIEKTINQRVRLDNPQDIVIPVVFHVLYNNQELPPDRSLAISQIEALNRDFGMQKAISNHPNDLNGVFQSRATDTQIRFCLTSRTPNNRPTDGIIYAPIRNRIWTDFETMKLSGSGSAAWNTSEYLNIWVCDLEDMNKGFAQFPYGPEHLDGIVINSKLFGITKSSNGFGNGSTLTHLVGNYLGLLPLWGRGECQDDYVDDTPVHNAPNYKKPSQYHISTCSSRSKEMTMNFMDNTYDSEKYMFTIGQMQRMQAVLSEYGPRAYFVNSSAKCEDIDDLTSTRNAIRNKEETLFTDDIVVVPNPAIDQVYISTYNEISALDIIVSNTSGQVIYRHSVRPNELIDVSVMNPGIYFFKIGFGEGSVVRKVVIN